MFENLDTVYKEEADAVFSAKSDVTAFFGTNEKRAKLLYKRLAAMFHPDVFTETRDKQDAEAVFKELGAIWDSYRIMHGFKLKAALPPAAGSQPGEFLVTDPKLISDGRIRIVVQTDDKGLLSKPSPLRCGFHPLHPRSRQSSSRQASQVSSTVCCHQPW